MEKVFQHAVSMGGYRHGIQGIERSAVFFGDQEFLEVQRLQIEELHTPHWEILHLSHRMFQQRACSDDL